MSKWVALFSKTGTEINKLMNDNYVPDVIYHNSKNVLIDLINTCKKLNVKLIKIPSNPTIEYYNNILNGSTLVTLHGYMRIISKEICLKYNIFNLHPGLIDIYPELKGKDPQIRAFNGNYNEFGCVIHHVTPKLDSGRIVNRVSFKNYKNITFNDLLTKLSKESIILWKEFLDNMYLKQ